ncbi:MAG: hypothetical protein CMH61_00590 [Nanoarchaeota archaeon]|nr:hypothetical protein [Nanoarchaeota archaeon]
MAGKEDQSYKEIVAKYKARLRDELGAEIKVEPQIISREYKQFKEDFYPKKYTLYEKMCALSNSLLRLKSDPKKSEKIQKNIDMSHLNVTPGSAMAFAILFPLLFTMIGGLFAFAIFQKTFFVVYFVFLGITFHAIFRKIPSFIGNSWRMKASNQMVQCVFYLVTYMRHTSNLERAIEFASEHLTAPLSLDMKKIIWDIETQKFSNVKDATENYLSKWKDWNKEFVEAFHLVESSLYEGSNDRRLTLLDKALDVILTGTYEKMLNYARELKSPMTMLHMMGIILPILGLVILPLMVSFMSGGDTKASDLAIYIALMYNVTLPLGVYYLGRMILSKRPTGYGDSDTSSQPQLKKFKNVLIHLGKKIEIGINPAFFAVAVFFVLALIGFSPLIIHSLDPSYEVEFDKDGNFKFLDYICPPDNIDCSDSEKMGPYGIGASILSLVAVLSFSLSAGLYYRLRSKNVLKIRKRTQRLEDEFSSALFQLGNRLGDGIPAEIAFAKVAETMQESASGQFFHVVERNVTQLGMSVERSIFDKKVGALVSFPSKVIESSMKVLVESLRKGPKAAAQAMLSMAQYIKEIHKVNERLKDLMADIISSMKSQIAFLTPAISGIVVGITSMVTTILTKLSSQLTSFADTGSSVGGFGGMMELFGIGLPTYYFQLIVGVYLVQLTYILTVLTSGIENGSDKLQERFLLGSNLIKSPMLYSIIAGVVILAFSIFATQIISRSLT